MRKRFIRAGAVGRLRGIAGSIKTLDRVRRVSVKSELGWSPKYRFEQAIKTTIQWYKDNQPWWRAIKSGEYLKYYQAQYAAR